MRFYTESPRPKNVHTWEPWFAWYPVKISEHLWVWFETVYRRRHTYDLLWEYRGKD